MINDRIAQNSIEPSYSALLSLKFSATFQPSDKGVLEDIFSDCAGLDTLFQKTEKLPMTFDKPLNDLG